MFKMRREVAIWELTQLILHESILVAARSKEWVYGRSLAGIADSNPAQAWKPVSCVLRCHVKQCFSTAEPRPATVPWLQLYRAARGSPGICHFSFLRGLEL